MSYAMHYERENPNRFLTALVLAGMAHALFILGVGFQPPEPVKMRKSLNVTLVHNPSREAPKEADFLAQENQFGSGAGVKKVFPRIQPEQRLGAGRDIEKNHHAEPTPRERTRPVLKQERSAKTIASADGVKPLPAEAEPPRPRLADVLSQQISDVSAEFSRSRETETRGPKTVYINSVTAQKFGAAAYEHSWQQKIERIGNLNYPDQARRDKLSGSLLLSVVLRPDGSVASIKVLHSSGHPVLDDAAVRIVQMSAPFSPFPPNLLEILKREGSTTLGITRTWRFYSDNRLEAS